jgi:hypothetical protein
MTGLWYLSIERAAAYLLLFGCLANLLGVLMFWFRGGSRDGAPPNRAYYVLERSSIVAAVVLTAIGFMLLADNFQSGAGRVLAGVGANAYFFGAVLLVAAEALNLSQGWEKQYGLVVIYVVVAFLAQAAIGGALLQSGLLAAWIGWLTVLWNMVLLVVVLVITPRDIYFPFMHHTMPLVIGIALPWSAS